MQENLLNDSSCNTRQKVKLTNESGVTMAEVLTAILVLSVGLLAVAASISYALRITSINREVTGGKLQAAAMLEQIETLRNTQQLVFRQIVNAGAVDNSGIPVSRQFAGFANGFLPITTNPGPDNIFGTMDDPTGPIASGTEGLSRKVEIFNLNVNLKEVRVTVRYPDQAGTLKQIMVSAYLNNDARSNRR